MAEPGPAEAASPSRPPSEMPALLVRRGLVYRPGERGPERIDTANGHGLELFDAFDRLTPSYKRIYIVDLDAVEGGEPQLDLWQEVSRDADLWIDGGVQTADQAIDILVAGARRAVLSTGRLRNFAELEKAWGLSQELAFEIELQNGSVVGRVAEWSESKPMALSERVRAIGPRIVVASFRGVEVDWDLAAELAEQGTVWVAGTYPKGATGRLADAGVRGGVFHPDPSDLLPAPTT